MNNLRWMLCLVLVAGFITCCGAVPASAHDDPKYGYHIHVKGKVIGTDGKGVEGIWIDYDKDNLFPAFEGKCYAEPKTGGGGWFAPRTEPIIPGSMFDPRKTGYYGDYEIIYTVKSTDFCLSKFPSATVDRSKIILTAPAPKK